MALPAVSIFKRPGLVGASQAWRWQANTKLIRTHPQILPLCHSKLMLINNSFLLLCVLKLLYGAGMLHEVCVANQLRAEQLD
jgi:hypothetical protein